jgi:hypothetical protein
VIPRRHVLLLAVGAALALTAVLSVIGLDRRSARPFLPASAGRAVESGLDQELGRVASKLVGLRVQVRCWSPKDWRAQTAALTRGYVALGHRGPSPYGPWSAFASPELSWIHLSPEVCAELRRLARERIPLARAEWPDALAWAVAALAHEAYHVAGIRDEAVAECYGMQSIARAARLLGRSDADARSLTFRYLKVWRSGLPSSYRSPECRSGGLLDLDPDSREWP